MKKIVWIPIVAAVILLAVLFVPIPTEKLDDGGTKEWTALTYKIVKWNKIIPDGIYEKTRIYFGNDYFKSLDELWYMEEENVEYTFNAKVIEVIGDTVFVEPLAGEDELRSADKISLGIKDMGIKLVVGDYVKITYDGIIMETYPAQIRASKCEILSDVRNEPYVGTWINKDTARYVEEIEASEYIIREIYSDCFIAYPIIGLFPSAKINEKLSDEWCVEDTVLVKISNCYVDDENNRIEGDLVSIEPYVMPDSDEIMCYKPVIYLYPENDTEVSVKLNLNGELTCTYPVYNNGWTVTASPDGTLTDKDGKIYNYLYWEGIANTEWDFSEGFCVKGEDTAEFLEIALSKLGLTRREANEFIVYWLPIMQENPYNIISFQTDLYADNAELEISPKPDTLIRVFMAFKPSNEAVEIDKQELSSPEREGFTAVEWGGTEVK